jgi:ectoine hydroxylase-related dioxygenase (phytanoyl-CoA dioxygenase family)
MFLIVAIDAADAGNGATEVFPGFHHQGCLTPRDGMYHQLPEDAVDLSKGVVLDLAPGDIAVFSGYTPHRSGANRSSQWCRLLYLSYTSLDRARRTGDLDARSPPAWARGSELVGVPCGTLELEEAASEV